MWQTKKPSWCLWSFIAQKLTRNSGYFIAIRLRKRAMSNVIRLFFARRLNVKIWAGDLLAMTTSTTTTTQWLQFNGANCRQWKQEHCVLIVHCGISFWLSFSNSLRSTPNCVQFIINVFCYLLSEQCSHISFRILYAKSHLIDHKNFVVQKLCVSHTIKER